MKWCEFYKAIRILGQEDQPDCGYGDFFERMAEGGAFAADLVIDMDDDHQVKDAEGMLDYPTYDMHLHFVIFSARVVPNEAPALDMKIQTVGVIPPGFVHGTYRIRFAGGSCETIPRRMFQPGNVPRDELIRNGFIEAELGE